MNVMDKSRHINNICPGDYIDPIALISALNEGIVILKEENIIYANHAFSAMVGQDLTEILGTSFADFISEKEKEKVMDYLKGSVDQFLPQDGIEFQFEKDPERYVFMKVSPIHCHDSPGILGYISDITKRRKERLEIRRLHTRLRSILDHMRDLVISFSYLEDIDEEEMTDFSFFDDHIVEINSSALAFYGVPASYFLNKKDSIFDYIHDDDKDRVLKHYISLFDNGFGEITYRITLPTGENKWVLDYGRVEYIKTGKVRRVNHIIEDITEKKKALDKIKASENKYRRIFELSKDMIYILTPGGKIIDINQAGIKLLGLGSKKEAALRNMKEFHVDSTARDALIQEIMEKGEVTRPRIMFKNVKGEKFEVGLNIIAQKDENGKVISYQGIVHNITEAIRQKELEAISQLAGCFADDLASPLSVILIGIETIKTFLSDIENITEKLSNPDEEKDLEEIIYEIRYNVSDIIYFINEVMIAVNDIKDRLKEIRDQYWNLKKVSDGSGGIIYERGSKNN
jgi:PAS domain S-box-containing protein